MVHIIDDFSSYSNGDLHLQDGTASGAFFWHRATGNIYADAVNDRAYNANSASNIYYSTVTASAKAHRIYMKGVLNINAPDGIVDIGVSPYANHAIGTGVHFVEYDSYVMLHIIKNGSIGGYVAYAEGCIPTDTITFEFLHNFDTQRFEMIKCDYVGYDVEDVAGGDYYNGYSSEWTTVKMTGCANNFLNHLEVKDYPKKSPYTSHVRWQKTVWGMRPCY